MAFLYYSPFRYAYSDKVQGFLVYPLGNYHMEDVWLRSSRRLAAEQERRGSSAPTSCGGCCRSCRSPSA